MSPEFAGWLNSYFFISIVLKEYGLRVFLAPGFIDMRKSINGLSILVDNLHI